MVISQEIKGIYWWWHYRTVCLDVSVREKIPLVAAMPILSLRWSIWGVSLSHILFNRPFLSISRPHFPASLLLSVIVLQITVLLLSVSQCLTPSPCIPCLFHASSMIKCGCQHDTLFPDCVTIGTLAHEKKNPPKKKKKCCLPMCVHVRVNVHVLSHVCLCYGGAVPLPTERKYMRTWPPPPSFFLSLPAVLLPILPHPPPPSSCS